MKTACVILAAGQGTRMNSSLPKVLHRLCGMPMLQAVVDAAAKLKPERLVIVGGRQLDLIREAVSAQGCRFALQKEPRGTGDAVRSSLSELKGFRGILLVLNGDTPLISARTIGNFLRRHQKAGNALSVLSFEAEDPRGYGRVMRDSSGRFQSIVEEKDADAGQKGIGEVNSGVYAIGPRALALLDRIELNRKKGEFYLTDLAGIAGQQGLRTEAYCLGREEEFMGVNTREELLRAAELMREAVIRRHIAKGVNFIDPASAFIHPHAEIGRDTTVYPNVFIEEETSIGREVTLYPNVRLRRSRIADRAVIKDSTVIEDSEVRTGAAVGPFAHIRPGSLVGPEAKIGNFVELKKAVVGKGSKASHLSYLGDTAIGAGVNIGAGTITCNYDGLKKHRTVIEDGVFVGSDTQFVAPVTIGSGAYIGAGSTITRDVPPGALAVSRTEQRTISNWAKKKKGKA